DPSALFDSSECSTPFRPGGSPVRQGIVAPASRNCYPPLLRIRTALAPSAQGQIFMKDPSTPAASPPSGDSSCPDRSSSTPPGTPGKRCPVAVVPGSEPQLSREIESLLRRRLRIAALISLAGFGLFLVRNLFAPPETPGLHRAGLLLHAGVVAVDA